MRNHQCFHFCFEIQIYICHGNNIRDKLFLVQISMRRWRPISVVQVWTDGLCKFNENESGQFVGAGVYRKLYFELNHIISFHTDLKIFRTLTFQTKNATKIIFQFRTNMKNLATRLNCMACTEVWSGFSTCITAIKDSMR